MAYVGFRDPKNTIGFRNRARFADPCDPFWKFARLSRAVSDKTGMLPSLSGASVLTDAELVE